MARNRKRLSTPGLDVRQASIRMAEKAMSYGREELFSEHPPPNALFTIFFKARLSEVPFRLYYQQGEPTRFNAPIRAIMTTKQSSNSDRDVEAEAEAGSGSSTFSVEAEAFALNSNRLRFHSDQGIPTEGNFSPGRNFIVRILF